MVDAPAAGHLEALTRQTEDRLQVVRGNQRQFRLASAQRLEPRNEQSQPSLTRVRLREQKQIHVQLLMGKR